MRIGFRLWTIALFGQDVVAKHAIITDAVAVVLLVLVVAGVENHGVVAVGIVEVGDFGDIGE